MNSTQKSAWMMLFTFLLSVVVFVYVGSIFVLGRVPPSPLRHIGPVTAVLIPLAVIALAVFFVTRRQSRAEPESDERDKAIVRNAVVVSFLTSWLLLAVVVLILGITLGQTGSLPVYVLILILFGVLVVTTLVYALAILVQYGRMKEETNHE